MRIEFLDRAENDLLEGYAFYERQQEGVGQYFLESLFSDIESLQLFAGVHAKVFGYHRLLSARFPYAIYYQTNGQVARVHAVLDCRQEPRAADARLNPPDP